MAEQEDNGRGEKVRAGVKGTALSVPGGGRGMLRATEATLVADYRILPAQIGTSFSKFFGVPYEPFNAGRIRIEALQGPLKREFVDEQGWLPLEETPEGLVVMCLDPEAVRVSMESERERSEKRLAK